MTALRVILGGAAGDRGREAVMANLRSWHCAASHEGTQMKRFVVAACCGLLLGSEAIGQERQNCTGPQLGTWKLRSFTREDLATGKKFELFGSHPSGYISYGPDCRVFTIVTKEGRKSPVALPPTDAERVDLYSGLIAYAGTYSIDGDKVSHHIDTSWNEAWTGTTQVRKFRIDGTTLHITSREKNQLDGRDSESVLIWTKVE
jgi:hypothetical protein